MLVSPMNPTTTREQKPKTVDFLLQQVERTPFVSQMSSENRPGGDLGWDGGDYDINLTFASWDSDLVKIDHGHLGTVGHLQTEGPCRKA